MFILKSNPLSGQLSQKSELNREARQYFRQGDYNASLNYYEDLKKLYPQQPEYSYYAGRCLVELSINLDKAQDLLYFAAVRGEHNDAWFYLGRAYQLNSELTKADQAYNRFLKDGKRSEIKKLHVKNYIAGLKNEQENKNEHRHEKSGISLDDKAVVRDKTGQSFAQIDEIVEQKMNKPATVTSAGNHTVTLEQPDITEYTSENKNEKLKDAFRLQLLADSMRRGSKIKRSELKEIDDEVTKKQKITEIAFLEKESKKFQKEADVQFDKVSVSLQSPMPGDTLKPSSIELKDEINGIKVYKYVNNMNNSPEEIDYQPEDIPEISEEKTLEPEAAQTDDFKILNYSPYNQDNPIPSRPVFSSDLIYAVQLGVFSKKTSENTFKGIFPVYYDFIESRGLYKYYAGIFTSLKAVEEALPEIKATGYSDSFAVAFYKNEPISLDKAKEIEFPDLNP